MRLLLILLLFAGPVAGQGVLTPELLWQLRRMSEPTVSPDGQTVMYRLTTFDLADNRGQSEVFAVPVAGGTPVQLTSRPGSEVNLMWRPDGQKVGFLARAGDAGMQWHEMNPDGSGLRQVTREAGGIGNVRYSPDGRWLSFTKDVQIDPTTADLYPDLPKADGRLFDGLMYRHWDSFEDGAYSHLFVAPYNSDGSIGAARDLMPGERFDTPLMPFGGVEQIAWSSDSRRLVYTAKKVAGTAYATSTNSDLYAFDLTTSQTTNLTEGNPGYDTNPAFSPDGRFLAYLSMARDGYEADKNRLMLLDLASGTRRDLTATYDNNANDLAWTPDSRALIFTTDTQGTVQLARVAVATGDLRVVTSGPHNYGAFAVAPAGRTPVVLAQRESMQVPADLYRVAAGGEATRLTEVNADHLAGIALGRVEARRIRATDGQEILTWVIYPPDFDPNKSYPALLYGQGGPQSQVSQFFSYRWNFQLMAANGYIVVAPNRRGLPGFGQAWNEQISGDWGGQAMRDLLSAIDAVKAEPYVDDERLGAVGASYGGFTVFWLAGHHEGRFKSFIAHAGVFNLESMYGATEEVFFSNWDMGGPYWAATPPPSYAAFSPHRFVGNWDTPMLVIHGEKDFRVPVTEGMQAFTALQLRGIPSRFLYFPTENHWILTPQNGILWQRVFFDWLDRTLKNG